MSIRAFIIGLLGVIFIGAFCFFNDCILYQTLLIGTFMPMSVFGIMIPAVLLLNPTLNVLYRKLGWRVIKPLTGKELCLVFALVLPACCIPYCSLMRLLPRAAMLPHYYAQREPDWNLQQPDKSTVLATKLVPDFMLAEPVIDGDDKPLNGVIQGLQLKTGEQHISPFSVPWRAWKRTLCFWLPLFIALWVALTGLSLVCHQQWSSNEHLPYPVVQFAKALFPDNQGNLSSIFHNKFFWLAMGFVLVVHINNYLTLYWPDYLIPIERVFNFFPLQKLFLTFSRGGGNTLFWIRIYFVFIGIAYLLPTDVSFACGLGPFAYFYITGLLAGFGISIRQGATFGCRMNLGACIGGYISLFFIMLYTGRHYYWNVIRRSVGLSGQREISNNSIWGMRIFYAGIIVFMGIILTTGLDWQLILIFTAIAIMIYLVLGRIVAETGMFYLSPDMYPGVLLVAIFGEQALGPHMLALIFLLTTLLFMDTRETFMPYMVNAVKFMEGSQEKTYRYLPKLTVTMLVCLVISVIAALYFSYDSGMKWIDGFATNTVPRQAFVSTIAARRTLIAQGVLEKSEALSGWQRFTEIIPHTDFLIAFGIAFIGAIIFSWGRLRYPKWPIHPLIFCAWAGYAGYMVAWSFVLGGILKVVVTKFGGSKCYQLLKPAMFGFIAGDMFSGMVTIVAGFVYYLTTGDPPKNYFVLPG